MWKELVNGLIASADLDLDATSHDFKHKAASAKFILAFFLPHEHELELRLVWVVVDELSEDLVSFVALHGDIVWNSRFDVMDVRF